MAEELQIVVEAINDEIMGMNEVALDLIEDVETQIKETEAECHDLHLEFSSWPMLQMASRSATSRQTFGQLKELDNTLDVFLDHVKQNLEKRIEPMCKERAILEEKTKPFISCLG